MPTTNTNILSLSFSRNRLGFAVFRHGHLDYYAGKTLSRYRTNLDRNRGMALTLDALVKNHGIGGIAFPKLNKQQRHSSELRSLFRAVRQFCARNRLTVVMQDPVQMRRNLTGEAKPSKANVLIHLIELFPELRRYACGGSEWERRYYGHIFTAIGSGMMAAGSAGAGSVEGVVE